MDIAKLKDLFQTCDRKVSDMEKYKEVKEQHFAFFIVNLAFNNTVFKDEYNIVECEQSDHHGVTRDP